MVSLRAATCAFEIPADDSMVIGGSILPAYVQGQETPLRATAAIIEADTRLCIVACDVLAVPGDLADQACERVSKECDVPPDNILITASHTHHAPTTFTVHGYQREEDFCAGLGDAIVTAARGASARLADESLSPNDKEVEFGFAVGNEATWGQNSRVLLKDDTIGWYGFDYADIVRPTGPFDPDLAVIALLRPDGSPNAVLFNHSTHNIGVTGPGRSPGVYGLTAQAAERRHGGHALFLPGAFGSSHNMHLSAEQGVERLSSALDDALGGMRRGLRGPVAALKRRFAYEIRHFDETREADAVRDWCEKWYEPATVDAYVRCFCAMREQLSPLQGASRQTWLQAIRLGEVALVGVPGELFASLGLAIKRRSPFRHTVVVGLANDEIGYIPDRAAYKLGGYQLWMGFHSVLPEGTGERLVDEAVALLEKLYCPHAAPTAGAPSLRPLAAGDAADLQRFYNDLSADSRRLFRPLGWNASLADASGAVRSALAGDRYDVVLEDGGRIVGWGFLLNMRQEVAHLGIALADAYCNRGVGRSLMENLVAAGRVRELKGVDLIVVQRNERARKLYERYGFRVTGTQRGGDGEDYFAMRVEF